MSQVGFPEKQTLSRRLAGKRFMKSILGIITYVREGKGREKDWQRGKLGCDGFSMKTLALWDPL